MALGAIAAADQLRQSALAIHQGHRHPIDLGLNPHIVAPVHPGFDGLGISQFVQAGMRYRVLQRTAGSF
ncbi:hypothetical protein D9M73_193690 [compost metagenome]